MASALDSEERHMPAKIINDKRLQFSLREMMKVYIHNFTCDIAHNDLILFMST